MDHSNHKVVIVAEAAAVEIPVTLIERGDVEVSGDPEVVDWFGAERVYCRTCNRDVQPGENGLADDWQLL